MRPGNRPVAINNRNPARYLGPDHCHPRPMHFPLKWDLAPMNRKILSFRYFFITSYSSDVLAPESMCKQCASNIFECSWASAFKCRAENQNPSTSQQVRVVQSCITNGQVLLRAFAKPYVNADCWPVSRGHIGYSFEEFSELRERILRIF